MTRPLVSVIVPVYGRSHEVRRALASVRGQSYPNLEVIVVDDASPVAITPPPDWSASWRLIRRSHNGGAGAARNTGVEASNGTILAFLDSDDEWSPEFLATAVSVLEEAAPDVGAVTTGFVLEYSSGRRRVAVPEVAGSLAATMVRGCPFAPGSTLVARRHAVLQTGPWLEAIRRYEDYDWLLRFAEHFQLEVIPQVLAVIHSDDQAPLNLKQARRDVAAVLTARLPALAARDGADARRLRATLTQEIAWAAWRSRRWGWFALELLWAVVLDPRSRVRDLMPKLRARAGRRRLQPSAVR